MTIAANTSGHDSSAHDHDDNCSSLEDDSYDTARDHRDMLSVEGPGGGDAVGENGQNGVLEKKKKGALRRNFKRFRRLSGRIVNDFRVQIFIILLIVVNAVMIGIGTFDFVSEDPQLDAKFQTVDRAFLIIFTIELVMQFIYRGLSLFTDGWLVFDLIIIVASWAFETVQIIRAFRVFRAFRLVTRIDTLRNLVNSLFEVLPRLSAIFMLLLLIFYIFAVMFTTLFKDLELSDDYFSSLDTTLFTLFQFMTMEWSEVSREVMEVYSWAWLPFVVFVAISGFIVFNLIIAVVCDAVAVIEQEKHDEEAEAAAAADAVLDEATQEKITHLTAQMEGLVLAQHEIQQQIDRLTKQYFELQGGIAFSPTTNSS